MIDPHDGMSETLLVVKGLSGTSFEKSTDKSWFIGTLFTNTQNLQFITNVLNVYYFALRSLKTKKDYFDTKK